MLININLNTYWFKIDDCEPSFEQYRGYETTVEYTIPNHPVIIAPCLHWTHAEYLIPRVIPSLHWYAYIELFPETDFALAENFCR